MFSSVKFLRAVTWMWVLDILCKNSSVIIETSSTRSHSNSGTLHQMIHTIKTMCIWVECLICMCFATCLQIGCRLQLPAPSKCLSVWLIVSICFYLPVFPIPHHPLSLYFPLTLSVHFSFTMNITTSIPEGPFQEITHYHPSLWHRRVGAFITTIRMRQQHMIASAVSGGL